MYVSKKNKTTREMRRYKYFLMGKNRCEKPLNFFPYMLTCQSPLSKRAVPIVHTNSSHKHKHDAAKKNFF